MFWDYTISKTLNICAYSLISVTLFSRTRRFSHFQKFHYFLFCFTKSFKRKLKSVRAIPLLLWIINLGIPLNQHCSTFTYFFISFLGKLMVFLTSCFLFFLLETKKEYIFLKNKKTLRAFWVHRLALIIVISVLEVIRDYNLFFCFCYILFLPKMLVVRDIKLIYM